MRETPAQQYWKVPDGTGWDADLAAHNPKVAGSNPAPATNETPGQGPFRSNPGGSLWRFLASVLHLLLHRGLGRVVTGWSETPRNGTATRPRPTVSWAPERLLGRARAIDSRRSGSTSVWSNSAAPIPSDVLGSASNAAWRLFRNPHRKGPHHARRHPEEGQLLLRRRLRRHRSGDGQEAPLVDPGGDQAQRRREDPREEINRRHDGGRCRPRSSPSVSSSPIGGCRSRSRGCATAPTTRIGATSSSTCCRRSAGGRSSG